MGSIGVNDLRVLSANFNAMLLTAKNRLKSAQDTQAKRETISVKLRRAEDSLDEIEIELDHMKIYKKLLDREEGSYKEKRTSFMESQIEESIARIFPTRNYSVKLTIKPFRGKLRASLTLRDKFGRISKPKMGEGKFCQQLIGFSASSAISKTYKVDKVLTDEAFSASSPENLSKVGDILKDLIESGLQIILVEQQTEVYKDLPRREFLLSIDAITLDVQEPEIIDY